MREDFEIKERSKNISETKENSFLKNLQNNQSYNGKPGGKKGDLELNMPDSNRNSHIDKLTLKDLETKKSNTLTNEQINIFRRESSYQNKFTNTKSIKTMRSDSESSHNGNINIIMANNTNNLLAELSELNSSTNSILLTSQNHIISNIKNSNNGPIKLNESFLRLKKSISSEDKLINSNLNLIQRKSCEEIFIKDYSENEKNKFQSFIKYENLNRSLAKSQTFEKENKTNLDQENKKILADSTYKTHINNKYVENISKLNFELQKFKSKKKEGINLRISYEPKRDFKNFIFDSYEFDNVGNINDAINNPTNDNINKENPNKIMIEESKILNDLNKKEKLHNSENFEEIPSISCPNNFSNFNGIKKEENVTGNKNCDFSKTFSVNNIVLNAKKIKVEKIDNKNERRNLSNNNLINSILEREKFPQMTNIVNEEERQNKHKNRNLMINNIKKEYNELIKESLIVQKKVNEKTSNKLMDKIELYTNEIRCSFRERTKSKEDENKYIKSSNSNSNISVIEFEKKISKDHRIDLFKITSNLKNKKKQEMKIIYHYDSKSDIKFDTDPNTTLTNQFNNESIINNNQEKKNLVSSNHSLIVTENKNFNKMLTTVLEKKNSEFINYSKESQGIITDNVFTFTNKENRESRGLMQSIEDLRNFKEILFKFKTLGQNSLNDHPEIIKELVQIKGILEELI